MNILDCDDIDTSLCSIVQEDTFSAQMSIAAGEIIDLPIDYFNKHPNLIVLLSKARDNFYNPGAFDFKNAAKEFFTTVAKDLNVEIGECELYGDLDTYPGTDYKRMSIYSCPIDKMEYLYFYMRGEFI